MSKHWTFRPFDSDRARFLENAANIPAVLAQILCTRGMTTAEQVQNFLDPKLSNLPKPQTLPGCTEVAERLLDAIRNKRKITVYGDHDVDGMTGTAILVKAIRFVGESRECANYYIPSQSDNGSGLNDEALNQLVEDGTQVVVTVDCGISAYEEAKTAQSLGIELLITDHHTPGPELPDARELTLPQIVRWRGKLESCNSPKVLEYLQNHKNEEAPPDPPVGYSFIGISGAMVAFKVAWALGLLVSGESKVTPQYQTFLLEAMGLATMGTIADLVPLVDENRTLVRYCLEKTFFEHLCLGLRELASITKVNMDKTPSPETIGYHLTPRLNAAGRMGQAMLGVELLLTTDPDRAKELAEYISKLNKSRQELERKIQKEALQQIQTLYSPDDAAFVLASKDSQKDDAGSKNTLKNWHSRIISSVAGRLSEQYYRPVVVISQDGYGLKQATGSARGIPDFNLYDALDACKEYLERFGGHASAAGLGIKDENITGFRHAFIEYCERNISEEMRTGNQTLWIDAEYPFAAFTLQTVQQLEKLAPFGCGNRRPILAATNVYLEESAKKMGNDGQHFSATFLQDGVALRGVAFGHGPWVDEMNQYGYGPFDLVFHVVLNTFKDRTKVELQILDWHLAEK